MRRYGLLHNFCDNWEQVRDQNAPKKIENSKPKAILWLFESVIRIRSSFCEVFGSLFFILFSGRGGGGGAMFGERAP